MEVIVVQENSVRTPNAADQRLATMDYPHRPILSRVRCIGLLAAWDIQAPLLRIFVYQHKHTVVLFENLYVRKPRSSDPVFFFRAGNTLPPTQKRKRIIGVFETSLDISERKARITASRVMD